MIRNILASAILRLLRPSSEPIAQRRQHDYTVMHWGHSFEIFGWNDEECTGTLIGHGYGIREGDEILSGSGRYLVQSIAYYQDPRDMWKARVSLLRAAAPPHSEHRSVAAR